MSTTKEEKGGQESALLTDRMRQITTSAHTKSNRLVNLKLALVLTSPPLYGEAISLFVPVYDKLESVLDKHCQTHEQLRKLQPLLEPLRRTSSFRSDVAYYLSSDRRREIDQLRSNGEPPELRTYLDRLDMIDTTDPIRIVSYVYHLYSAIFAGGAIIQKAVMKSMGIPSNQKDGVRAFILDQEGEKEKKFDNGKELMKQVKHVINTELSLSKEEEERILQESLMVFQLNNALISTIRGTNAFQVAMSDCTKRIVTPLIVLMGVLMGVLMVAYVSWRYLFRHDLDEVPE